MAKTTKSKGKKKRSITFRYRWVCDSGHTTKKTGPYQKTYGLARKGGDAHDKTYHEGVTTSTIEISATSP